MHVSREPGAKSAAGNERTASPTVGNMHVLTSHIKREVATDCYQQNGDYYFIRCSQHICKTVASVNTVNTCELLEVLLIP